MPLMSSRLVERQADLARVARAKRDEIIGR
jgi:hypothetical protein